MEEIFNVALYSFAATLIGIFSGFIFLIFQKTFY